MMYVIFFVLSLLLMFTGMWFDRRKEFGLSMVLLIIASTFFIMLGISTIRGDITFMGQLSGFNNSSAIISLLMGIYAMYLINETRNNKHLFARQEKEKRQYVPQ